MRRKTAIITGIASDLGSYLAGILHDRGYEIHALGRAEAGLPSTQDNNWESQVQYHQAALTSYPSVARAFAEIQPDECYHLELDLAGGDEGTLMQQHPAAAHTLLQLIRDAHPQCRFVQAVSHEVFGDAEVGSLSEEDKFHPDSPAAIAQVAAFELARHFRRSHGLYACNALLFPHASPRSGADCLMRRITAQVARIKLGLDGAFDVDSLCARYDWGHTEDWARGLWQALQQGDGDDYVFATGQTHTVRELIQQAFACAGLDFWSYVELADASEDGDIQPLVQGRLVLGDAGRARRQLGWHHRYGFKETIVEMVREDMRQLAVAPLPLATAGNKQTMFSSVRAA